MNKSNSKIVKDIVRNHIEEFLVNQYGENSLHDNLISIGSQFKYMQYGNLTLNDVIKDYIMGGSIFTYDIEVIEFINSLNLNNKSNKTFDSFAYWNMYIMLFSREINILFRQNKIDLVGLM